jgi:hypothetical protein
VRPDGDPDTYLETDGLATSSSNGRHDAVNSSDFVLLLLFQSVSQLLDCPFIYFLKEDCPFKRASLCSQASAAYTERLDDEEVLCGAKEEEWARVQEPAKTRAGRATPGIGFEFCHWFCFQISMVYCFIFLRNVCSHAVRQNAKTICVDRRPLFCLVERSRNSNQLHSTSVALVSMEPHFHQTSYLVVWV